MLISVLMPVYNGERHLDEAISSVLSCDTKNIELLIVDDGSDDSSPRIIKDYEKNYPNIIRVITKPNNTGLAETLNLGLEHAKSNVVARINQDDRMKKNRLTKQIDFMLSNPDVVACGSCIELFFDDGHIETLNYLADDQAIKKVWHMLSPFSDTTVMYRRDKVIQAGGYMQKYWPADDTHLWMRLGTLGKLANIQEPLMEVRWHDNSASVKYFRKMALSTLKMHLYAHKKIQKANIFNMMYWLLQFTSGLCLSPQLNWKIYRLIKRITTQST